MKQREKKEKQQQTNKQTKNKTKQTDGKRCRHKHRRDGHILKERNRDRKYQANKQGRLLNNSEKGILLN